MDPLPSTQGGDRPASPITAPLSGVGPRRAPQTGKLARLAETGLLASDNRSPLRWWEPFAVFWLTLLILLMFVPRMETYLSPKTGDEPFYLMTAISLLEDGDLNECNNYREMDEAKIYPAFYTNGKGFPPGWLGISGAPFPLTPHPAILVPESRMCASTDYGEDLPSDGTGDELYSKHGLGLTLLILPAFALGGLPWVTFFLVVLGALLATNIYLLAREVTGLVVPAVLTWAAFALTVPLVPYSYLIFPELPAALLVVYAFRRIREWENNPLQTVGIGAAIAFLPWLHYRFVPVCAALGLYFLFQIWRRPTRRRWSDLTTVLGIIAGSAGLLMAFFYHRYQQVLPNASDHAGTNDVPGVLRATVGLLLDEQWGLLVSAPVFLLVVVGAALMARERRWRLDLLWVVLVFVPYYFVIASYSQWWGEWCPPARYLASTLPVMAVPFSIALARARSVTYYALYAVLLVASVGMLVGYLYQPQWMYNQPYRLEGPDRVVVPEDNKVITEGLGGLLRRTPMGDSAVGFTQQISNNLPSFVLPSLYYSQGSQAGVDYFAPSAWRQSITPAAVSLAIIALGLALAWPAGRRRNRDPNRDRSVELGHKVERPALET
jgi:hypothetical protein